MEICEGVNSMGSPAKYSHFMEKEKQVYESRSYS